MRPFHRPSPSVAAGSASHRTARAAIPRLASSVRFAVLLAAALPVAGCGGDGGAEAGSGEGDRPDFYYPGRLTETAPDTFRARFETSAGDFVVQVHRDWSPRGADRFYNLVRSGWYDDQRIYRVVPGFMSQWGLHGDPVATYQWRNAFIDDDPVVVSNTRGRVTFATCDVDCRIQEIFVNTDDNPGLDAQGFSPFGEVVEGMEAVDAFYGGYGDGPPRGEGPYQAQVRAEGNAYLDAEFPELTRIERAVIEGR